MFWDLHCPPRTRRSTTCPSFCKFQEAIHHARLKLQKGTVSAQKAPLGSWTQEILEQKRKKSALLKGHWFALQTNQCFSSQRALQIIWVFGQTWGCLNSFRLFFSCFTLFPGLMSEKEQNNSVNGLCLVRFSPKGPRKKHSKPQAVQQKIYISEIKQTMTLSIDQKCHVQKTHWWPLEQGRKVYKLTAVWCWSLCVCL